MTRKIVAAVVIPMLVACGGGAPETTPPPPSTAAANAQPAGQAGARDGNPCSLVSDAEVTAIMGHPMKRVDTGKPMECGFHSASDDPTKSVSYQVVPGTQMFDQMGAGTEPLAGVGEKAALMGGGNVAIVVKGGRTFMGGVYDGANLAAGKERTIALAKKVVAGM